MLGGFSLAAAAAVRSSSSFLSVRGLHSAAASRGWFDRLLPAEDPAVAAYRAAERKIIREKLTRSRFAEFLAAHKDKGAPSAPGLSPSGSSPAFPAGLDVEELAGAGSRSADPAAFFGAQRATLVTLAFAAVGQKQLEPWLGAWASAFAPRPLFEPPAVGADAVPRPALLNIVYLDGWFFALARRFFAASVRGGLPPAAVHASGLVVSASERATDHALDALGVRNRVLGHIFLIDARGRVRWRAQGDAAEGELDALMDATRELLVQPPQPQPHAARGGAPMRVGL